MNKFEVKNMDLYYGSFHALKNVNISIPEKEITAFIGPSGCGKSTFLKSLNRMNDLVEGCRISGDILLDGVDIYKDKMDVNVLRKRVGMVFQKPNPFPMSIYGTNAVATGAMIKAGASAGATGENAVIVNARRADVIAGPLGIVMANSMMGECSPAMALAVADSPARKVLIPVSKCGVQIGGLPELPLADYIADAARRILSMN